MRDIKFRAYDKKENEMFYSGMYQDKTSMAYGLSNFLSECSDIEDTLMQYTGLKDKNGVKIYEGDICRCWGGTEFNGYYEYNKIYEVKWQGSGFDMTINDCGYGWNYSSGFDYIEIIGNIYQNPELLEN